MVICNCNRLLMDCNYWFFPELFEQAGMKDVNNMTALDIYRANAVNIDSTGIRKL